MSANEVSLFVKLCGQGTSRELIYRHFCTSPHSDSPQWHPAHGGAATDLTHRQLLACPTLHLMHANYLLIYSCLMSSIFFMLGAPIASVGLYLAPLPTIQQVTNSGTVGSLPLLPYTTMAANAWMWTTYGMYVVLALVGLEFISCPHLSLCYVL